MPTSHRPRFQRRRSGQQFGPFQSVRRAGRELDHRSAPRGLTNHELTLNRLGKRFDGWVTVGRQQAPGVADQRHGAFGAALGFGDWLDGVGDYAHFSNSGSCINSILLREARNENNA